MTKETVVEAVDSVASLCMTHMVAAGIVPRQGDQEFASRVATETLHWLATRCEGNSAAVAALGYALDVAVAAEKRIGKHLP